MELAVVRRTEAHAGLGERGIGAAGNNFHDVTSDGQRFLMPRACTSDDDSVASPGPILVQNFSEDIKRLVRPSDERQPPAGTMFWFRWKMFSGSYRAFTSRSRS